MFCFSLSVGRFVIRVVVESSNNTNDFFVISFFSSGLISFFFELILNFYYFLISFYGVGLRKLNMKGCHTSTNPIFSNSNEIDSWRKQFEENWDAKTFPTLDCFRLKCILYMLWGGWLSCFNETSIHFRIEDLWNSVQNVIKEDEEKRFVLRTTMQSYIQQKYSRGSD